MIANYHTHTPRCGHASGEEKEYVEEAIRGGLKILAFSDHAPVPYKGDYYSPGVRMQVSEIEDYVDAVVRVKEEYRRDIEIHLGFEMEYYPGYIDAQLDLYRPYPIEFFLLGQHFLGDEIGSAYSGRPTEDSSVLTGYCRQTEEALRTGLFTYFAHPDLVFFTGDEGLYEKEMRRLCQTAKELDIPLEINLLGIETNRNYPKMKFWELAGETGNTVILGSDAHVPENTYRPDAIREAERIVEKYQLNLIDQVDLVNPFAGK
jgi:histidinol-phosphatase (PHP family)